MGNEIEQDGDIGVCGYVLWFFSAILVVLFFPFSLCVAIKVVTEYERAVIFRLGRVASGGAKGPGLFFLWPCIDEMKKVDLRTVAFDVPPQEVYVGYTVGNIRYTVGGKPRRYNCVSNSISNIYLSEPQNTILTKDSVTVAVDAVVYFRVFDPIMSVCNVDNAFRSGQLLAATTLRNVLGTKLMSELLTERDSIAASMQSLLDTATDPWGIKVERVEIKDVRLPVQLQRAMAAEAEATREARAKVVAAEGEQNASRALKEAADVIMESPAAMQLRYLQTLGMISGEKNSTIIFPLPIDMMAAFMKK